MPEVSIGRQEVLGVRESLALEELQIYHALVVLIVDKATFLAAIQFLIFILKQGLFKKLGVKINRRSRSKSFILLQSKSRDVALPLRRNLTRRVQKCMTGRENRRSCCPNRPGNVWSTSFNAKSFGPDEFRHGLDKH